MNTETVNTVNTVNTSYRESIDSFIKSDTRNLFIAAGAGCGKTTTIVHNYKEIGNPFNGFLAFNKSIADELKMRGVSAQTMHSLGLSLLRKVKKNPKIEADKIKIIIKNKFSFIESKDIFVISRLISLFKNIGLEINQENIDFLIFEYGLEIPETIIAQGLSGIVKDILTVNNDNFDIIDFDDMIYLPVIHGMIKKTFKTLFIDESQDLNNIQFRLISGLADRYIFVGDKYQSIYGFRGANTNIVNEIINSFNCEELPLPVTYRCPKSHVNLVNSKFPEISFIAKDGAKEGEIIKDNPPFSDNEMILCRFNAPLVRTAFQLIRDGKKASIKGRDIGKGLISIIKKSKLYSLNEFATWLDNWKDQQISRAKNESMISGIEDRYSCLKVLMENDFNTTEQLINFITDLFSDDKPGIILSSVHRAKGLESDTIRIIEPGAFGFIRSKAKNQDQKDQERNCEYVAYTRSKNKLIISKKEE